MSQTRNQKVDVIRGIAIFMVVMGQTLTGCTANADDSLLFNIIWSLQMPLFMLVSGYVTKYSRELVSAKDLFVYTKKRTISYLLPFASWTFLIRGILLMQKDYLNIKWLAYHMDTGYWFLFSLWTIAILFGLARWIGTVLSRGSELKAIIYTLLVCALGAGSLAIVGVVCGLSFLGVKLTLYYLPFYLLGFLFGKCSGFITSGKFGNNILSIFVACCVLAYIAFITRVNTFALSESILDIALRALISLLGCIALCGLIASFSCGGKISAKIAYIGKHSLELYVVHHLFLCMFRISEFPEVSSILGIILFSVNFAIAAGASMLLGHLMSGNKYLKMLLFGKR